MSTDRIFSIKCVPLHLEKFGIVYFAVPCNIDHFRLTKLLYGFLRVGLCLTIILNRYFEARIHSTPSHHYLHRRLEKILNYAVVAVVTRDPLRWLKMGRYKHSLSLDATIMVLKHCPVISEHVVIIFVTQ